jgi:hypothetical protein
MQTELQYDGENVYTPLLFFYHRQLNIQLVSRPIHDINMFGWTTQLGEGVWNQVSWWLLHVNSEIRLVFKPIC